MVIFINIHICLALGCKINNNQYVKLDTLNEQLLNIRVKTLSNYDEIINSVDKLKEDIFVKDIKISDLIKDFRSIKIEYDSIIKLFQEHLSTKSSNTNFYTDHEIFDEELNNSKLLIAELIKQLDEGSNVEIENNRLFDLVNMLSSLIINNEQLNTNKNLVQSFEDENRQLLKDISDQKEWQKHLENENEKLNSKIENLRRAQTVLMDKEKENNDIKENYIKMQCMYDDLREENAHLNMLVKKYKHQLTKKEIRCIDSDALIKTLESNLTEQTNSYKQAISMYNTEKGKCHEIQCHTQQIIDEFTTLIHEKQIDNNSVKNECSTLKYQVDSAEAEIENLKHTIITLEYALNEKNKIIQDLSKKSSKQQNEKLPSMHFKDQEVMSKLVVQMTIVQDDLCQEQLFSYESLLYNMQNYIEQQYKLSIAENENKKLTENINKKNIILIENLQKEIECLKSKHNLQIKNLMGKNIVNICIFINIYINFYFSDTVVNSKNEIQNLKTNIKQKNSQIIIVEKIASSQLSEAFNIIERLKQENQVCNKSMN